MSVVFSPPRTGHPYLDEVLESGVLAMAHRGGPGHPDLIGLENTAAAFQHAWELGFRYLETDAHVTRDGIAVAFHDPDLERLTEDDRHIEDLTAADLATIRIGGAQAIPTVKDLLTDLPGARFNIDLKSPASVAAMIAIAQPVAVRDRLAIASFSRERIRKFRRALGNSVVTAAAWPEASWAVLLPTPLLRRYAETRGFQVMQIPFRLGNFDVPRAALVARAHAAGLHVHVWTVNEVADMHHLIDIGIDGIMTDRTDRLARVLQERRP